MISDNDFFFYQKFQVLTWKWYSSLISKKIISDILNSICWYQKVMLDIRNWNWFFFKTNYLSEIQKILEFTRHNQKIQMIFYSKQWFFLAQKIITDKREIEFLIPRLIFYMYKSFDINKFQLLTILFRSTLLQSDKIPRGLHKLLYFTSECSDNLHIKKFKSIRTTFNHATDSYKMILKSL